jgi:hypothetical protein
MIDIFLGFDNFPTKRAIFFISGKAISSGFFSVSYNAWRNFLSSKKISVIGWINSYA